MAGSRRVIRRVSGPDPRIWLSKCCRPDDRPADIRTRVEEYLLHGVPLVVAVGPRRKTVATFRQGAQPVFRFRRVDDDLDLGDVVADLAPKKVQAVDTALRFALGLRE